jgi:phenylpyruvate tautomerase PptA (4-oxalocrotonate tautomerase family)
MCDAYIPADALPADAERELISRVSDLLVKHELRRTLDLGDGIDAETITKRASAIAWISVLRHEAYVAGSPALAPHYKFVVNIPEGQADEEFRNSVTADITMAVAAAEAGRWPHPEFRVWVFTWEVPEGTWGATGRIIGLEDVVGFVAPPLREQAQQRMADHRRDKARGLLGAADGEAAASRGRAGGRQVLAADGGAAIR